MTELPNNPMAEQALIGCLLADRDAIAELADTFPPEAFAGGPESANAWIFRAIRGLFQHRKPCDLVTLTDMLDRRNLLDKVGGRTYIAECITAERSAVHIGYYADIVLRKARQRALIDAGSQLVAAAYRDDLDIDEVVGDVRRATDPFVPAEATTTGLYGETIAAHVQRADDRWAGILVDHVVPTGWRSIDRLMMGGMRSDDLVFIGGRPGSGKTSAIIQMAHAAAKRTGKTSVIVELEMSREAMLNRAISSTAGVPFRIAYDHLGDPFERDLWRFHAEQLKSLPVTVETTLSTTDKIAAFCERISAHNPVGVVFIDHIDLLTDRTKGEVGEQRTAELVRRLRRLNQHLRVPIVVLSQLNRSVEAAPPFMPTLKHFKQSGEIEAAADYALLYYRRKYYVDKNMLKHDALLDCHADGRHKVELLMAKNRNGEVTTVNLGWQSETMSFHEVASA